MEKFKINWNNIYKDVVPDRSKMPLGGNEDKIIRVAFDLYKVQGDMEDDLWQLQADDDGNEFLIRVYSLPEEEKKKISSSNWAVSEDSKMANLTVSYKGIPIKRVAMDRVESKEDFIIFRTALLRKLALDRSFVIKMLKSISGEKQQILKHAGMIDQIKDWLMDEEVKEDEKEEIKDFLGMKDAGIDNRLLELERHLKEAKKINPFLESEEMERRRVLFKLTDFRDDYVVQNYFLLMSKREIEEIRRYLKELRAFGKLPNFIGYNAEIVPKQMGVVGLGDEVVLEPTNTLEEIYKFIDQYSSDFIKFKHEKNEVKQDHVGEDKSYVNNETVELTTDLGDLDF